MSMVDFLSVKIFSSSAAKVLPGRVIGASALRYYYRPVGAEGTMAEASGHAPYEGPIALGMVFDYEPGKKHAYERLTITRREGQHIWAFGRSGETYHDEDDFRKAVVF